MREIDYWIWLSSLEGLSSFKAMQLIEKYKHPKVIYELCKQELKAYNILTEKNIKEILDPGKRERVHTIYELMVKNDIKMININDDIYPFQLKQIYDPPIVLYYKGKFDINEFTIAVVGSRKTTNYGAFTAKKLSYDLAISGIQIVSGLARGIDSYAHEGCLDAGGKTISVLGCGLDSIYPPENHKLCENIVKSNGLVLSEYPPGMPPLKHNFPARNRIISGIASGVIVVEAAKNSGSLITASYALEQGREVFAVPGNIDCAYSKGTNQLIKDGAKIVLCAQDILEEFPHNEMYKPDNNSDKLIKDTSNTDFKVFKGLSTSEIRIVKLILNGMHNIDEIITNSNYPAQEVNNILFMLEIKGVIIQQPGKIFDMYC